MGSPETPSRGSAPGMYILVPTIFFVGQKPPLKRGKSPFAYTAHYPESRDHSHRDESGQARLSLSFPLVQANHKHLQPLPRTSIFQLSLPLEQPSKASGGMMTLIKDAETPFEVEWHIRSEAERWGLFAEEELRRGAHRYFRIVVKRMNISGEGNGNPLQYSCLENLMDGRA